MTNIKTKTQIVDEEAGLMIRVDKTLKEMMEEKPSSRWDVDYWHPQYEDLIQKLKKKYTVETLEQNMLPGTQGITYGQVGQREYDENGEIQYLQVSNIQLTGVDIYCQYARIKKNSHNDPERSRLNNEDLLLINGGVGSLGRSCIFLGPNQKFNISQDIDRIRLSNKVSPYYVSVFINSFFGRKQVERFQKGVSGQTKIGFDHVKFIRIPILNSKIQRAIKEKYTKMYIFHEKAMGAKKNGDEKEFKENSEIAEEILRDLIDKTEQVIRGERDNVI